MSIGSDQDPVVSLVRTGQITIGAMAGGVLIMLAVGHFAVRPRPQAAQLILTYVAVAYSVMALGLSVVVPRLLIAAALRSIARGTRRGQPTLQQGLPARAQDTLVLAQLHRTKTIVAAALLEGAAMFDAVAYFVEGAPLAAAGALILVVALAIFLPTLPRVEAWIDDHREKLEEERGAAS
jgi:hypothetical protein